MRLFYKKRFSLTFLLAIIGLLLTSVTLLAMFYTLKASQDLNDKQLQYILLLQWKLDNYDVEIARLGYDLQSDIDVISSQLIDEQQEYNQMTRQIIKNESQLLDFLNDNEINN